MRTARRGYSVYELLLTLALIAVLAGVALPSFGALVARSRLHAEANALFHAAHLARKESIMRRAVVTLCASADGSACSDSLDWTAGWLMFENRDADSPAEVDPGEPVLRVHKPTPGTRVTANRASFTLRATQRRATNGTLTVCDEQDRAPARAVVISYTGRPRVALEDTSGTPYACAD